MNPVQPVVGDQAVEQKTGKGWQAWFEILDAAGARAMSHKEIVAHLKEQYQVDPWWQQMITVTYEQARSLRGKHQKTDGYQISRNRTIAAPLEDVFAAWADQARRAEWLPDPGFTVRKSTEHKSLRVTWVDGQTSLDVAFTPKGPERTQVAVQHSKLESAERAEEMKSYWSTALERLTAYLSR